MEAGKLRHPITILTLADTRGLTFGEAKLFATTFASVWASVEPLSGRELVNSDRTIGVISHRIRLRYLAGVTDKMQVQYGSRIFNIVSVINKEERNTELELMCLEKIKP